MRISLMASLLTALIMLSGCVRPIEQIDTPVEPVPSPIHSDEQPIEPEGVAVSIAISPSAWAFVSQHLNGNTITIHEPIKIEQDDLTVNVPANCEVALSGTDDQIVVTFSKPYPVATKFRVVKTDIHAVTLKQDGSGLAQTGIKKFAFRWTDQSDSGAGTDSTGNGAPESSVRVLLLGAKWCGPCQALVPYHAWFQQHQVEIVDVDADPQWNSHVEYIPAILAVDADGKIIELRESITPGMARSFIDKYRGTAE